MITDSRTFYSQMASRPQGRSAAGWRRSVRRPEHPPRAAWSDAATVVPWALYVAYGDRRILAEQYDSMKAWVDFIRGQGEHEHIWNTGFHFGDWLALDAKEGSYMVTAAYFALSTRILRDSTRLLGRAETAVPTYERLVKAGARDVHFSYFDRVADLHGRFVDERGEPFVNYGHFSWIYALNDDCRLDYDGQPVVADGKEVSLMAWLALQKK